MNEKEAEDCPFKKRNEWNLTEEKTINSRQTCAIQLAGRR